MSIENSLEIQSLLERIAVLDDKLAFEQLFSLYNNKLKRFVMPIIKSKEAAEDIASDVFVKIWQNRSHLISIDNINNYLYVSAKNIAIRHLAKLRNCETATRLEDIENEKLAMDINPEEIVLNNELINKLEEAVNQLPARCQQIYRLAKQDGLKYKEIATILNISVKTIDAQMAIAVCKITESIKLAFKEKEER